ncbi:MAG TPA: isoprenylcysteine carboxylmethyltransferase family protein [Verrucomicrobiae bacterium]|nr:isoprenylcysteine carboxylmethyltransferase family protein [Verrucomicrobiae bacterium]
MKPAAAHKKKPSSAAGTASVTPSSASNVPPASATNTWIVLAGFAALVVSLWFVRWMKIQNTVNAAMICMGAVALANFLPDLLLLKVHRRASTGIDWNNRSPSWNRVFTKFLGLLASLSAGAALYGLFPEYHGEFYNPFWELMRKILPWWIGLAIPYFYLVDSHQAEPEDGYYHAGLLAKFQFRKVDFKVLRQHALGWLVKIFFMALMFTYLVTDLRGFINYDFSTVKNFRTFFEFSYFYIFLADVALGCVGYLLSLRICDTHLRWAEPTAAGWLAALACYQPFWSLLGRLYFDYSSNFAWGPWLQNHPTIYCVWGAAIILLYGIYLWATIVFGCRFSNLTHRGIITNGPYRWTKHPAYIAKNLAYWMTFVPFIVSSSVADSIRRTVLLLLVNWIYWVRARTEEAHLSQDPAYVEYQDYIRRHGIFRWMGR